MLPLEILHARALDAAAHACAPYSGRSRGAAVLLSDGAWVPGARIESAAYSLVLPAAVCAVSAAVTAGRRDIAAIALSDKVRSGEAAYLAEIPTGPLIQRSQQICTTGGPIPVPGAMLPLSMPAPDRLTPIQGIALAREAAQKSLPVFSGFPVGCILQTSSHRLVAGVNVEHPDWTRTICAERAAIAASFSIGCRDIEAIYLSCLKDASATPCGACRQLLLEWAPGAAVWMDRGDEAPENRTVPGLLPSGFGGTFVRSH